jgi:plasmid stabilization system protein ParE
MAIEFHPEAEEEFIEAAQYYEARVPGIGSRFIDELEALEALLTERPAIGEQIDENFRRVVFRKFPFSLIYTVEETRIWVVAVAHQRRLPGYWRDR